jgi:hypothetical protein
VSRNGKRHQTPAGQGPRKSDVWSSMKRIHGFCVGGPVSSSPGNDRRFPQRPASASNPLMDGAMTRRALVAAASFSAAAQPAAAARWRLFLTGRHVAFHRGVRFVPQRPALSDENLLPAEHPWEAARVGPYASLIAGPKLRLWYSAHALLQDAPRIGPGARIFTGDSMCYAESEDGLHFRKPRLDLIPFEGSRKNNIVLPGSGPCVFVDRFDRPERRFKMLAKNLEGSKPEFVERWPEARGADRLASYLLTSSDGLRWRRDPDPIIPFSLGSQRHILWDDRIGRWSSFVAIARQIRFTAGWKSRKTRGTGRFRSGGNRARRTWTLAPARLSSKTSGRSPWTSTIAIRRTRTSIP